MRRPSLSNLGGSERGFFALRRRIFSDSVCGALRRAIAAAGSCGVVGISHAVHRKLRKKVTKPELLWCL